MLEKILSGVSKNKKLISDAFDYLWANPEVGYKEWKADAYLKEKYKKLGYELTEAGNIPGFTALIDTGRPGPTVVVFGEMDALFCSAHPMADPDTGAAHACGHCAQSASLLGIAAALKEPGALDDMSGRILLAAVPAEELIDTEFRKDLAEKGIIKYFGGKQEFIYRGLLDKADMAIMIHSSAGIGKDAGKITKGSNGFMLKNVVFHGVAAHAGGAPHKGKNAFYAANNAISAINALRETFRDDDHIRVHGIITSGGDSVNAIPDRVSLEYYVRGATKDAIVDANRKINRALAGAAVSMGCTVTIEDRQGYLPRVYDPEMMLVAKEAMELTLGETHYMPENWGAGCSDFGDITALMPGVHPFIGGSHGAAHGKDFGFEEPADVCENSSKAQLAMLWLLLKDGAARAKHITENFKPSFESKEDYLKFLDDNTEIKEAVTYNDDGSALVK